MLDPPDQLRRQTSQQMCPLGGEPFGPGGVIRLDFDVLGDVSLDALLEAVARHLLHASIWYRDHVLSGHSGSPILHGLVPPSNARMHTRHLAALLIVPVAGCGPHAFRSHRTPRRDPDDFYTF